MCTSTVLAEPALPEHPVTAIDDSTVPWSMMVTSVGFVAEQPGGPATVSANVVVRVALVPVPVTVTVYVPTGVLALVAMVSVDEPPEVIDDGLNDAVAPLGRPDADRFTVCALPLVTVVPMVAVTEPPAVVLPEAGDAAIEKSLPAGVPTASVHSAYAAASAARFSTVSLMLLGNVSQEAW
jgi:hypothetical protein